MLCASAAAVALAGIPEDADAGLPDSAPELHALQHARAELAQAGEVLSAAWLIGRPVQGRNGPLSAEVNDLVANDSGHITALVVHARGMRGSRGGLFKIPWSQVELTSDYTQVLVPLTQHNARQYRLGRIKAATNERRVSLLIRSRVALRQGEPYGRLTDALFSPEGELKAVVIEPFVSGTDMRHAYPFRTQHYREGIYTLDYDILQVQRVALPDSSTLDIVPMRPRAMGVGATPRTGGGGQQRYDSGFPLP